MGAASGNYCLMQQIIKSRLENDTKGSLAQENIILKVCCTKLISPVCAITNWHKNLGSLVKSGRVPADLQRKSLTTGFKQEKRSAGNSEKGKIFLVAWNRAMEKNSGGVGARGVSRGNAG
ncbi:hypothetical protein GME_07241 [Halomonas sp. TD01]|nr:hypothetical protein GME_07241 [Halomonas sp. TD01]